MGSHPHETKLALVSREANDLLVVSFRPQAILDESGMAENLTTCSGLTPTPVHQLWEIPEDADFRMSFLERNHFAYTPPSALPAVLAVVCSNDTLNRLIGLYFAYHPQGFPVAFFHSREAALA